MKLDTVVDAFTLSGMLFQVGGTLQEKKFLRSADLTSRLSRLRRPALFPVCRALILILVNHVELLTFVKPLTTLNVSIMS